MYRLGHLLVLNHRKPNSNWVKIKLKKKKKDLLAHVPGKARGSAGSKWQWSVADHVPKYLICFLTALSVATLWLPVLPGLHIPSMSTENGEGFFVPPVLAKNPARGSHATAEQSLHHDLCELACFIMWTTPSGKRGAQPPEKYADGLNGNAGELQGSSSSPATPRRYKCSLARLR